MKRICILLSILIVAFCAYGFQFMGGKPPAVASCTTAFLTNAGSITGDFDISDNSDYLIVGQSYIETGEKVVCKVTATLTYKTGDISSKEFYMIIDTKDGSHNLELPEMGRSDVVIGDNAWSATAVTFTFSSPVTLAASTNYGIGIWMDSDEDGTIDADDADGSNYAEWEFTGAAINGNTSRWEADGTLGGSNASDQRIIYYE